jgi:spore germination protein GerM
MGPSKAASKVKVKVKSAQKRAAPTNGTPASRKKQAVAA